MRLPALLLLLPLAGCVAPKFVVDIPATQTPARYYRPQDAANFVAGAAVDQSLRLFIHGPTVHYGQYADSTGIHSFHWTSGDWAPAERVGVVILAGGIRRQLDRGYREGGWLDNAWAAVLTEVANLAITIIKAK